jgi:hypothetical protein
MDVCAKALIGFVCAHGDSFELLELAEEVIERQGRSAPWMLCVSASVRAADF